MKRISKIMFGIILCILVVLLLLLLILILMIGLMLLLLLNTASARLFDGKEDSSSKTSDDDSELSFLDILYKRLFRFQHIQCKTTKQLITTKNYHIYDDASIECMVNSHRQWYQELADLINNKKPVLYPSISYSNNIKELSYSLLTKNGCIYNYTSHFINGSGNSLCINLYDTFCYKSNVISISATFGDKIWHFPFECLVSLRLFLNKYKNLDNYYLHIEKKTNYIKQWLELADIPINWDKVISGNVFCKKLMVCQVDPCGNPSLESIYWLKKRLTIQPSSKQDLVVLIKRCHTRCIKNFDALQECIKSFAKQRNYTLYIHDDATLPSLKQQMQLFSRAAVVVGSHGAGGVNLLGCKENTYFIELMDSSCFNLCYSRLACLLNLKYYCMNTVDYTVDIQAIQTLVDSLKIE